MAKHTTKAMFHATAMVPDYDATVDRLATLIGLRVLEYTDQHDPAIGRRGGMTWIGDGSIELCEPIVDGAPPDRFVQRTGGGMQGVALWVEDFAATVEHLDAHEAPMPVQMPDGFGFSSPRATAGLQFEWAEFTVDEDPRIGAPVPEYVRPPLLDVTHLAYVGAVVDDPIADARRLASLFDTTITFEEPDAADDAPVAGVSVGDCTLALHRRLDDDESRRSWGRTFDRPRVSLAAVRVADLDAARDAIRRAGVGIVGERDGVLVLDPSDCADIEVAVVTDLLPGDPRS